MRVENAGARTWLLGAVALWALCVLVLALAGLGGRVSHLPEDPALVGRLPQPIAPVSERLGPLAQYTAMGDRPLFTDDRRPQPFFIDPAGEEGAAAPTFNFTLTSVIDTPRFQMAILQNSDGSGEPMRVKIGAGPNAAPGWTLRSVDTRSAIFDGPEGERTLELRVYDGNGGQPPTAVNQPNAPQNVPQNVPPNAVVAAPPPPGVNNAPPMPPQDSPPPPEQQPTAEDAAANTAKNAADSQAAQEQIESIRKRIEARRARLRQEAAQRPPATPGQNP